MRQNTGLARFAIVLTILAWLNAGVGKASSDESALVTGKLVAAPAAATYEAFDPGDIVAASDGVFWFVEGKRIGRITATGRVAQYTVPGRANANTIAMGPGGTIWVAGQDFVAKMAPSGWGTAFPLMGANARALTLGPDGNMWVAESGAGKIASVTPSGVVKEFSTWPARFQPQGIVSGPDGRLWITDSGNSAIVAMSTSGLAQTYPTPTRGSQPGAIIRGKDGNLWFIEVEANQIGRITTAGSFKEYHPEILGGEDPKRNPRPVSLTWGPDGNVWLTEPGAFAIRRLSPSGAVKDFFRPYEVKPYGITAGLDGNVWFTEGGQVAVSRISTAGDVTAFPLEHNGPDIYPASILAPAAKGGLWLGNGRDQPSLGLLSASGDFREITRAAAPAALTSGPDGSAWFIDHAKDAIAVMSPAGKLTEYPTPTSHIDAIAVAMDGTLWFVNSYANTIGKATFPGPKVVEFPIPTLVSQPGHIAVDGAGNAWFSEWHGNKIGRVTPAGAITEYRIPTPNSEPGGIAVTPNGTVWFTETTYGGALGSIDGSDKVTEFKVAAQTGAGPACVATDRLGNAWFAVEGYPQSYIGRVSPAAKIEKFAILTAESVANACAVTSDGSLWFLENRQRASAGSIGKVTTLGSVTEYLLR